MTRYRKLPVEIEAWRIASHDPLPEWLHSALAHGDVKPHHYISDALNIETLEGVMVGYPGDYLIRGVAGEVYPCRADIFAQTYERVDG